MGRAVAEGMVEDTGGSVGEDVAGEAGERVNAGNRPLRTAREARLALARGGVSPGAAHRALLSRDPKYGKAVREAVKATAPKSDAARREEVAQALNQTFETVRRSPEFSSKHSRHQDSMRPTDTRQAEKKTQQYSMAALRRQLGYDQQSSGKWDEELDALKKKKWYES